MQRSCWLYQCVAIVVILLEVGPGDGLAQEPGRIVAYEVPAGTVGNQDFVGPLGMDFDVRAPIRVHRLGVFDSGSDGLTVPLASRIFDRTTLAEVASVTLTPDDPGELIGGSRFKALAAPIDLPAGFQGVISADGFAATDLVGNRGVPGAPEGLATNPGPDCSLHFVGSSRYGLGGPGTFPEGPDGGPANRYAAGSFEFEPLAPFTPAGGIAYVIPAGTPGNQEFGGSLGHDFNVLKAIMVTRLGVFDAGSDGLGRTITARLYNRDSQIALATLTFTPADPGDLVGGSRLKALDPPLRLRAGFHGTMAASGYGAGEPNGNGLAGQSTDDGGCLLAFVGAGSYSVDPNGYPGGANAGLAPNPFRAGTFEFQPAPVVADPPLPPTGLAAVAGDGSVSLSWIPPSEGPEAVGYNIYRMAPTPRALLNPEPVTGTSYTAADLIGGGTYCFAVASVGETGLVGDLSAEACAVPTSGTLPAATTIAYIVPAGMPGNQAFGGSLGLNFKVNAPIIITSLGVFDSASDGLLLPIAARLHDGRTGGALAALSFTPDDPGTLVGGSRFKDLAVPLELPAGFQGTVVADGYGVEEPEGNQNLGLLPLATDSAGCAISFQGGRYGDPGGFPGVADAIAAEPNYAAGTFQYGLRPGASPSPGGGGIAYVTTAGTPGNQDFAGALGLDFNVLERIKVTELGVFDHLSDGLFRPITARLFNRDTRVEIASLTFTPEDPGTLDGGFRLKPLGRPLYLPAGFRGVIAGEGYGPDELVGNGGGGAVPWTTDDGGCLLEFVGGGRYNWPIVPGAFPGSPDGGPPNRYASGTFRFAKIAGALQVGGDCNQDGSVDISDVVCMVSLIFRGFLLLDRTVPQEPCGTGEGTRAVLDVNGDAQGNISDIVYLAMFLFQGGRPPAQGAGCFEVAAGLACPDNSVCP
jgi:hypothetical protein